MSKIKGAIAITVVALFLSGCGQYKALPTEERYQFINEVKDAVDLPSSGEIVSESYDNGDGVFSPSVFRAEGTGNEIYKILSERIKKLSEVKNCNETKTQLTCQKGQVHIFLAKFDTEPKIEFILTDSLSGRNSNGKN